MATIALSQAIGKTVPRPSLVNPNRRRSPLLSRQRRQVCRAAGDTESTEEAVPPPVPAPPKSTPNPYAGSIRTDTAGITVIDVIEPTVYVEGSGSSLETGSSSAPAVLGAALALVGAAAALTFLYSSGPSLTESLSLSEYIQMFEAEVEASAPTLEIVVESAAPALTIEAPTTSEEPSVVVESVAPELTTETPTTNEEPSDVVPAPEPEEKVVTVVQAVVVEDAPAVESSPLEAGDEDVIPSADAGPSEVTVAEDVEEAPSVSVEPEAVEESSTDQPASVASTALETAVVEE